MGRIRIDRVKFVTELERRNMTQTCLAELSGVSRATVSYIKCGKSCSDEVGQKIADALGVDVTEILED
ncbi:MAG: helix-turn-helix transcriptional regulator [Lachnospiraceae bacterium]|nr:helix-turn-helix transcriptional regulator [Lachnospiraceae bacterium]